MPTFIGLDLAWTTKNESGICWLEGDSRENLRCIRLETAVCETESLADDLSAVDGPVVATIDAPVVYTPERWADHKIGSVFGRYKVGAHSSHAAWRKGYRAGVHLGEALRTRGFSLDPHPLLNGDRDGRFAVEVFPHTIHVILFGLAERLPYKRKKGRNTEFLQRMMREYQTHLRALIECECPRVLEHPGVQSALDPASAKGARGQVLKRLDDTLDGLTCAIAAWLMWDQPERWQVLGDLNGYIVVPKEPDEPRELKPVASVAIRPQPPLDPIVSVRRDPCGIDVQISTEDSGLSWEIRVRLEGDDLTRVVTVVERLE